MNERIPRLAAAAPVLIAIAEEGSLSRAALRLGLHQTAVSHRIRSLEDMLGHVIFLRTTRSLTPTEVGRIVLEAAQATIGEWGRALDRVAHEFAATRAYTHLLQWLREEVALSAASRRH
ncbi:LysR family transcriptional regulator [Marinobacter changyiensis]|uniref:LysR family transcriptional regulator n=1 Tax=Marinobacter changyiensis TaxID=2604091 RepID=UPI001FEB6F13|nr:LysR family transcriptional regulator [Marinobacter changyiensis]